MRWSRLLVMMRKEFIQLRRDPRLFGILLLAPVVQLVVLGSAADTDVRDISLSVRDNDRTRASREYVRALSSSGYLQPIPVAGPESADADSLVSGESSLLLVIPRGFGASLGRMEQAAVQVLVDGTDSTVAVQGLNHLQNATRLFNRGRVRVAEQALLARTGIRLPRVEARTRLWYNPALLSKNYMVPAIMGILLLVTTMLVTSMALVKEREDGTMEQLVITPIRPMEIMAGKLLPFAVVGFAVVTLAVAVIVFGFRVPLRGNLATLYLFTALFLPTTLGLGLFLSTLVRTQQQAMLLAGFGIAMPFVLLSGFIFPIENMPAAIRFMTHFIPLKYFIHAVRGIFLRGSDLAALRLDAAALAAFGVGILLLASVTFRKRQD
jgi:ABC-2 type transport system permease protein